jgi:hypothetical protein
MACLTAPAAQPAHEAEEAEAEDEREGPRHLHLPGSDLWGDCPVCCAQGEKVKTCPF